MKGEKSMNTKSKISARIICVTTAAAISLCVIVAQSSVRADCVPPPTGLVSWWPGDGNADDIVRGNNGALQNGATFTAGIGRHSSSLTVVLMALSRFRTHLP